MTSNPSQLDPEIPENQPDKSGLSQRETYSITYQVFFFLSIHTFFLHVYF